LGPAQLLLFDASEYALYGVHRELSRLEPPAGTAAPKLVPLLGSVCDEERIRAVFATWRPHTVYHAAAYKHVPLVEHNPAEGVRNNVVGTMVCAAAARDHQAERFVLVSTDKAVRPTNVMGASKRLAEMFLQGIAAEQSATRFSMVRFGNVLGSSGSVVPLFRQQIQAGGPVTVTHREITRYFMTIPESAELVIQAGAMATGGEVFVLEMGEPVRVADLAKRMISLSGLKVRDDAQPDGDIEIVFTGLRPGEKLYEELLIGNNPAATSHPRILKASESFLPLSRLLKELQPLRAAVARGEVVELRERLMALVPEYTPEDEVVDWVYLQQRAAEPTPHPRGTITSNLSLPVQLQAKL
jgi:FlaA1/EpsC-like NDP-sugar epimerase